MSIPGSVNPLLLGAAASIADDGYQIERSLRFNSADSAYLSRTPSVSGNRKTWTWAGWVKRSALGGTQRFFIGGSTGAGGGIQFESDTLFAFDFPGSLVWSVQTSAVFRDPSSWYHIVLALDTTQATSSNRVKLYVNGSQQTALTSTYPTLNYEGYVNAGSTIHTISSLNGGSEFFSGYLADIHFIDGQALDPTSFGEFDTNGIWQPKAYTGTYGTNGGQLKFEDNSSNTATTLGKDTSPNGNNWTPNNLSVTAGAGNDSLVDVPTNGAQTDTGVGGEVRGNYCTLNPLDKNANLTVSDGNLSFQASTNAAQGVRSTFAIPSGVKVYAECLFTTWTTGSQNYAQFGIATSTASLSAAMGNTNGTGFTIEANQLVNTVLRLNGSSVTIVGAVASGDVFQVAVDLDNLKVWLGKNNTWYDSSGGTTGNPATGANPTGTLTSGVIYFPAALKYGTANAHAANFGQRPFAYTAPSGFKALNTANLPAPVVTKPSDLFDVKLYTGNGSTQTISGLGFSPDLVWIKGRSGATDHALYDTVRGVQRQLESNTTTDETTESTGLTAFNSDGFALGALAQANTSSATYAAWCWDESVSAGFDIVTYTGNGSARTIAHSLGVAPSMIIVKARTTASTDQGWPVYHSANTAAPATDYLLLNSTAATADLNTVWNDTAPTSSVFSVGTNALVNANADTYVAYCFAPVAGYSSFGSYTGNGSADGPFVYTGFRPRWILAKESSVSGQEWFIHDTARDPSNVAGFRLTAEGSFAENVTNNNWFDILSNGFKMRTTNSAGNGSGTTYIYAAFAEHPFQYARAR